MSFVQEPQWMTLPEPLASVYGYSPFKPLDEHVGWPNLRHREPDANEVRELQAKHEQLREATGYVFSHLSGAVEGGMAVLEFSIEGDVLRCWVPLLVLGAVPDAGEQAEAALAERRWEEAVAHLRYLELLVRLAMNWGHGEVAYDDGELRGFEDHLDAYLAGNAFAPVPRGVSSCLAMVA